LIGWLGRLDKVDSFFLVFMMKWQRIGHQLINHHSQSPNINKLIVTTRKHFWSFVKEGSGVGPHLKALELGSMHFSNFKINKLEIFGLPIVENILRFYISVTNTISMQVGNDVSQLTDDDGRLLSRKGLLSNHLTQSRAIAIF
jgi:hypothetical protein